MSISLWAASKTMGHYFTVKKVMVSSSIAGAFSGVVLLVLSIFYGAKDIGGAWAPGITAVSGVAILLLSALGIYGCRSNNLLALVLHMFLLSMLSLFVAVVGLLTVAYPHVLSDFVHQHWREINRGVVGGMRERHMRQELADNLMLLGTASLLFAILLVVSAAASFATCLETYRKKKAVLKSKIHITAL